MRKISGVIEPGDDEIHVNVHIGQADPEHEAMAVAGALGL